MTIANLEAPLDDLLTPQRYGDFIGQDSLKERIGIHIASALARNQRLEHVLLVGPPGSGKTTFSKLIAVQMDEQFLSFVMPIEPKLLAGIVKNFRGIVLLDEIHRATTKQQETLLTVVQDGYLQMPSGQRFYTDEGLTIIGATTEPEKIIPPLYDRFLVKPPIDDYTDEEMAAIVQQKAGFLNISIDEDAALVFGRAAGGVPRNAGSFVVMARDLLLARGECPSSDDVLATMRVTRDGLTEDHVNYLAVLKKIGGCAGLKVLSNHLRLPEPFLLDLERLLVKQSRIEYTAKGRELVENHAW